MKHKIIPAILEEDFNEIKSKISLIKDQTDLVQLDICDGRFVKVKTWPFTDLNGESKKNKSQISGMPYWQEVDYEVHLMVENPAEIMDDFVSSGAIRLLIHIEIGHDKCFDLINEWGKAVEIGLSVNLETDLAELTGFFDKVSTIQLMGRGHLGEQGFDLDNQIFSRIKQLQDLGFNGNIAIDGGVNLENFQELIQNGADRLAVGSVIWQSNNPVETLKIFQLNLK